MKAWQIVKQGEPEQALECVTTTLPEPGPGELSITVAAAGVGLPDLLMCRGSYEYQPALPFTPGQEVAGRVLVAGAGVKLRPGQRVMGVNPAMGVNIVHFDPKCPKKPHSVNASRTSNSHYGF